MFGKVSVRNAVARVFNVSSQSKLNLREKPAEESRHKTES